MNRLALISFLFLAAINVAYGLKCYVCGGTEEACSKDKLESNKSKYLHSCPPGMCMRIWTEKDGIRGAVSTCGNKLACNYAKEACDKIKEGKCAVGCCDTDACNAATPGASLSVVVMLTSVIFGVALLK